MDNQLIRYGYLLPEKGEYKLDKLKRYLVSGNKLAVRDQKYFEKMKKA